MLEARRIVGHFPSVLAPLRLLGRASVSLYVNLCVNALQGVNTRNGAVTVAPHVSGSCSVITQRTSVAQLAKAS